MEAEGMILLVDTRKDPAVLSLNHEMTKDFNLQTMLNNGSDAYKLKAPTKESFAYDGISAKGDTASPHPKGTQQNIPMLKMGLRNQEGTLGPNTMKHDEMNNLQKMLGQIKTYPPRFPERRLYHLPSHFIGDNDSVLQHSPSPGVRLMTALARDQIKDNNFSSPLHKTVKQMEEMENWSPLPKGMDETGPDFCFLNSGPPSAPNTPEFLFEKKTPETRKREMGNSTQNEKGQFQNTGPVAKKTVFEVKQPSVFHYPQKSVLGPHQYTKLSYPSYIIAQRIYVRPIRPPPTYNIFPADRHVLQNSAAFSIGRRLQGTWKRTGSTPGPWTYDVDRASSFIKHCRPSYTIRGTRREKRHDLGPFATF